MSDASSNKSPCTNVILSWMWRTRSRFTTELRRIMPMTL